MTGLQMTGEITFLRKFVPTRETSPRPAATRGCVCVFVCVCVYGRYRTMSATSQSSCSQLRMRPGCDQSRGGVWS